MAWETRPNGRKFFYHSYRKQDGSVGRKYCGSGKRAQAKAKEIDDHKRAKLRERVAIAAWRAQLAKLEEPTDKALQAAEDLIASWLLANGFWKGKNNDRKWRKRRAIHTEK